MQTSKVHGYKEQMLRKLEVICFNFSKSRAPLASIASMSPDTTPPLLCILAVTASLHLTTHSES